VRTSISQTVFILLFTLGISHAIHAFEVGPIDLPHEISIDPNTPPLHLNGAGIRSDHLFIDGYVGALYLNKTTHSAEGALLQFGAKRMHFHILYPRTTADNYQKAWHFALNKNNSSESLEKLSSEVNQFLNAFNLPIKHGDIIDIDYLPTKGTRISINGQIIEEIESAPLFNALLNCWIGPFPVSESLKKQLLGIKTHLGIQSTQ